MIVIVDVHITHHASCIIVIDQPYLMATPYVAEPVNVAASGAPNAPVALLLACDGCVVRFLRCGYLASSLIMRIA